MPSLEFLNGDKISEKDDVQGLSINLLTVTGTCMYLSKLVSLKLFSR